MLSAWTAGHGRRALVRSESVGLWHVVHKRSVSTLPKNPHIYAFPASNNTHVLSYLATDPPNRRLAIGTTASIPPTPNSLTANPAFLPILDSVVKKHAWQDPSVKAQAAAYASAERGSGLGLASSSGAGTGGSTSSNLGLPANHPAMQASKFKDKRSRPPGPGSATGEKSKPSPSSPEATVASNRPFPATGGGGPTSAQGGMAGASVNAPSRGGWIHVSDSRNPPDWGRIAWPEDIFGSLEVDGNGEFVDNADGSAGKGNWQSSGTYRIVTNEGMLGLTDFLREKLVVRLKELEKSN